MSSNTLLKSSTSVVGKLALAAAVVVSASLFTTPKAEAARCTVTSSNASCTYQQRSNSYWCGIVPWSRTVRWQVPEGTPPTGGWRTAFYYIGTAVTGTNPFSAASNAQFGMYYQPQIFRELLDNPSGNGKKYAVFAPEPPSSAVFMQFWHTNSVTPYSASCDYGFFPDFFSEISGGNYGSASQYNMSRRFAFGISSGGYNSSRMAVTFNGSSVWKALGVISASYATCVGPICSVPTLPSNHPPTKFWHGTADNTVPISTMRTYYDKMGAQGLPRAKLEHGGGHELNATQLGSTGVKAYFDLYY